MNLDGLEIRSAGAGTRLRLRVRAGARRTAVEGVLGAALRVAVTRPPERGRANAEVVRLLADKLGLPRSAVRIVAGETSRDKTVEIEGLGPKEVVRRLVAADLS